MNDLVQIAAKIRNVFSIGKFQKRGDDGKIQVLTHNGRTVEKKEAFPYGFYAKAKGGRAFVICQGGNMEGFEILPVRIADGVTPPSLEEGDVSLFTEQGGVIILRNNGEIEIKGKVKVTGGSFECGGTVSPTGQGALCGMLYCAWNGAPQAGNKSENT